jgi:nucleoside-diphosphate-sugar epimerase
VVTGSLGWIGGNLCRELSLRGWEILGFDKKKIEQDIIDNIGELRWNMKQAEVVFNCAGEIRVPRSNKNPDVYWRNNTYAAALVFKLARDIGIPCIHISTSSCVHPQSSHYAATKYAAEIAANVENSLGADIRVCRVFNVYGWDQPPDYVVPRFTDAILRGEPVTLHNGGMARKDYVYIKDVVSGLIAAYEDNTSSYFEIGSGELSSPREIASILGSIINKPVAIQDVYDQERLRDPEGEVAREFPRKWSPKFDIRKGLYDACYQLYSVFGQEINPSPGFGEYSLTK